MNFDPSRPVTTAAEFNARTVEMFGVDPKVTDAEFNVIQFVGYDCTDKHLLAQLDAISMRIGRIVAGAMERGDEDRKP
jgi:hypothetical protein